MVEGYALRIKPVGRRWRARIVSRMLKFCCRKKLRGERLLWELLQGRARRRPKGAWHLRPRAAIDVDGGE